MSRSFAQGRHTLTIAQCDGRRTQRNRPLVIQIATTATRHDDHHMSLESSPTKLEHEVMVLQCPTITRAASQTLNT